VRASTLPRPEQTTVVSPELAQQETSIRSRDVHPIGAIERERRFGEGAQ
jgi:hypothetical protein